MYDVDPVTLGTDGTVLILGGFGEDKYDIYSFDTDQTVTMPLPETVLKNVTILPGRREYRAVWSEPLKSVVFFGGLLAPRGDLVSFYHPESKQWSSMKTTGLNRTLTDHCIALTDDGKKLLTFGGSHTAAIGAKVASRELHILDLASGKWTVGANSLTKRVYSACTVAGDYFLLWGGQTEPFGGSLDVPSIVDFGKPSTPVAIYHISQDGWVDEYQPSPDYLNLVPTPSSRPPLSTAPTSPTTPPTPGPSNNTASGSKFNIGVIAGGAAGAAVVIIAIGLILWRRKKQGKRHSQQQGGPSFKGDHPASVLDDIPKEAIHNAKKTPQPLSHLEGPPASHYTDGFGNANDSRYDHNLNTRHTTKPENSILGSMPPTAGAPHYPSWGANFNSQYVYEAWVRANTAFGPEEATVSPNSPTYGTYSPPPPTLSYVPEDSTGRRNPQALGHRPVMERYDYSGSSTLYSRLEQSTSTTWTSLAAQEAVLSEAQLT
ncbi:hypothetical protein BGW42_003013 [Actinomortierella wolfii]|nr:hypothetical protein BGW42_003013 [Actinomortierella wolfii]